MLIVPPVIVLFHVSLLPHSMVPSAQAFSPMSLKSWTVLIQDPISLLPLKNSLFCCHSGDADRRETLESGEIERSAETLFFFPRPPGSENPACDHRYNNCFTVTV